MNDHLSQGDPTTSESKESHEGRGSVRTSQNHMDLII